MTKELALEITNNASRCTEATLRAFGIDAIPKTGSGILEQLKENGYKCSLIGYYSALKGIRKAIPDFKSFSYLIYTKGHAMAVIEGHLIDTERKGWNNRRIEFIWKVEKV